MKNLLFTNLVKLNFEYLYIFSIITTEFNSVEHFLFLSENTVTT